GKFLSRNAKNKINSIKVKLHNYVFDAKRLVQYGKVDFFDSVLIETATACNRKCSYCPNSIYGRGDVKNNKLMDVNLYRKIIDDLASIGFKGVVKPFFYNEPLLDKRMEDLVTYTRQKLPQSVIHIATNGDYLNMEKYNSLVAAGINSIYITAHRKEMPPHIAELLNQLKDRDEKVHIHYIHLTEDSVLDSRGGLMQVKNKNKIPRCVVAPVPLQINYEGNVFLCCNDYFTEHSFGNVNTESILDIWKKPEYAKVRKELYGGVYKFNICKKCVA
ncbi:MAG: radical SAM/SPASM domain-containing protein, partial [Nanoarchaeota archaeon]